MSPANERDVVVCVDDEPAILAALARALRHEPYDLVTTGRPPEAIERIECTDVGLLLADQRMPEMSGTELLKLVRARSPATARVILTGFADLDAVTAAVNEGAVHRYLHKPWDDDELRRTIRQLLRDRETDLGLRRRALEVESQNRVLNRSNDELERFLRTQTLSLRLSQEMLDQVHVPVAAVAPGETGIASCNEAFLRLIAGRRSSLRGKPIESLLPAEVCAALRRLWTRPGVESFPDVPFAGRIVTLRLSSLHNGDGVIGTMIRVDF